MQPRSAPQEQGGQTRRQRADAARRRAQELEEADYRRPQRECDMVMKGGITSGVAYPLAVCELARTYRFGNLGGASAGAIAAGAAAAAEHGRASGGFAKLARLPTELGTRLERLFLPSDGTGPVFRVLLAAVEPGRAGVRKGLGVAAAAVRNRPLAFGAGLLAVLGPGLLAMLLAGGLPSDGGDWAGLVVGVVLLLVPALVAGLAGTVVGLGLRALRELPRNAYGLCAGSRGPAATDEDPEPPLTDWMARLFDDLAGVAGPLTFGDLWGSRAARAFQPGEVRSSDRRDRKINLEVMTTNTTHGRPMRLPFEDRVFLFCRTELAELFPPKVVDHLVSTGDPAVEGDAGQALVCPTHGEQLRHVPPAPQLPVVVAARMSLSFPGLVSAVPLYAVDYSRADPADQRPVRCWFSDGGISSNFPMHFFDALWPSRPTFGLNLASYHPDHLDADVYYPGPAQAGRRPHLRGTESLTGFLAAILDTMQNWSDEGQSTLPGYRDRIVDIHHTKAEGGINLSMPPDTVALLADRGRQAAEELRRFDFAQHRWTRFLSSMSKLEQALAGMEDRYRRPLGDGSPPYRDLLLDYGPRRHVYSHSRKWVDEAVASTDDLMGVAGSLPDQPSLRFTYKAPRPDPDLRITPHF